MTKLGRSSQSSGSLPLPPSRAALQDCSASSSGFTGPPVSLWSQISTSALPLIRDLPLPIGAAFLDHTSSFCIEVGTYLSVGKQYFDHCPKPRSSSATVSPILSSGIWASDRNDRLSTWPEARHQDGQSFSAPRVLSAWLEEWLDLEGVRRERVTPNLERVARRARNDTFAVTKTSHNVVIAPNTIVAATTWTCRPRVKNL